MERIYTDIEGHSRLSFDSKTASTLKSKKIFNYNLFPFIVSAIIAVLFLFPSELLGQITTIKTPTLLSPWIVPNTATRIKVEAWGAGGGGGGATSNKAGSGGGGGGYAAYSVFVNQAESISFTVGSGGAAGTSLSSGGVGGTTSIKDLIAAGGTGGQRNAGTPGTGGSASGGITTITGDNGTQGVNNSGPGGAGGNGAYGGDGGATKTAYGPGNSGTIPGGGGGGSYSEPSNTYSGGAGANGQVSISYSTYALTSTSASDICVGNPTSVTLTSTTGSLPAGLYYISYTYSGANNGTVNSVGVTITGTTTTSGSFTTATFLIAGSTKITITKIENTDYGNLLSTGHEATISVNANLSAVNITPSSTQTICEDGTGTPLTANETGGGIISRAWGKRSVTGGVITQISGATGNTYTPTGASLGPGSWLLVCTSTPTCGAATISNDVPVTVNASGTWLGIDNNWHNAANWCGGVPTDKSILRIPNLGTTNTKYPTISASAICKNIVIESGASLIDEGGFLTVTASSTMIREINDTKWHFLSSPVQNQQIWPAFAPTPTSNLFPGTSPWNWDFYYYNPNCQADGLVWVNLRKNDGSYNDGVIDLGSNFAGFGPSIPTMTVAKGYLVAYASGYTPTDHTFSGTLNTGDKPISFPNTVNIYNLIGNPYPSSLDWTDASWVRTDLASGSGYDYWVMNDGVGTISGNYVVFNSGGTGSSSVSKDIAPGQAFWVKASGTGILNLTIPNDARTHSTQAWLKNSNLEANLIRLHLKTSGNTYSDEMIVDINPEYSGTEGSDKLWSFYAEAPEIYAIKGGNNYTIDRYKDLNTNLTVNIGTKTGIAADYTITATNIQEFNLSSKVLLEDLKTGIVTDLKQTPAYNFAGAPGDDANRFRLIIGSPIGIDDPNTTGSFNIYTYENMVYVQNDKTNEPYFVTVSNMLGQTLVRTNFTGNSLNRIEMQNVPGVYVVNVVSNGKTYSQKVVIR